MVTGQLFRAGILGPECMFGQVGWNFGSLRHAGGHFGTCSAILVPGGACLDMQVGILEQWVGILVPSTH